MVRAFVVYEAEPDADRYEQHAELCRKVPGSTFRHGRVFGAPRGEPQFKYYAEWEFADLDAFKAAARTEEFMATGKDGMEMGIPFQVYFAKYSEAPGEIGGARPRSRGARVHPLLPRLHSALPASPCGLWLGARDPGIHRSHRGTHLTEPTHPRPVSPDELGFEKIVYEKAPPRATITFNRPEILNAFDFQMLRELARACEDASWDDEIRVVVLTGAGRAFCVGADLSSWAEDYLDKPTEYWKWFGAFKDAHDRLREIGKPTVARINGIAVGGGNEFQMACDLAVMVDDAFIRHVGPEHGSVPAGGATQWLTIMVGDRRAREIVLMCEEIPAKKCEEWGLVNRVVPAAELDAEVDRMVENLARKLPQTTRYAKQHLNFWKDLAWHETINHARDWLALSMATEEPTGRDPALPRKK